MGAINSTTWLGVEVYHPRPETLSGVSGVEGSGRVVRQDPTGGEIRLC